MKKINIPKPKKYSLQYIINGEVKTYIVSLPIEAANNGFTAYAFKKGVRTFLTKNVVEMKEIIEVQNVLVEA